VLITLVASVPSWAGDLDPLDWILGSWTRESRRGDVYESWTRVSERTFEGASWIVSRQDGARHPLESLLLADMSGTLFYVPKVSENEYPIPFRCTSIEPGRAVFENPTHDFPQKIVYERRGDDAMVVTIEGPGEGDEATRRIEFSFRKAD
jgi:hypothetical protein